MISNVGSGSRVRTSSDNWGMMASLLCGIHCAVSPIIYVFAPVLAQWWSVGTIHLIGALLVVPIAIFAFSRGYTRHKKIWPMVLGFAGSLLIILALFPFWVDVHPVLFTWSEGFMLHSHEYASNSYLCCPTVATGANGQTVLSLPWPTLITLLGSIFLVTGHLNNCTSADCTVSGCTGDC